MHKPKPIDFETAIRDTKAIEDAVKRAVSEAIGPSSRSSNGSGRKAKRAATTLSKATRRKPPRSSPKRRKK